MYKQWVIKQLKNGDNMKFMSVFGILLVMMMLTACNVTWQDSTVYVPAPVTIASLVASQNAYRESLGQTYLTEGLSCSVQAVSSGQWLSASSPGYNSSQGTLVLTGTSYSYLLDSGFNQANSGPGPNDVIDPSIQALFETNNYRIGCSGQIVVIATGYHEFDLYSDDGAILTINGTQVINNDGNHGITEKSGTINLRQGVYSFSMQYAQSGAGQFALILNQDGNLLPAANLYH